MISLPNDSRLCSVSVLVKQWTCTPNVAAREIRTKRLPCMLSSLGKVYSLFHYKRRRCTRRRFFLYCALFPCLGDFKSGNRVFRPPKFSATLTTEGISREGIQEGPGGHWCCSGAREISLKWPISWLCCRWTDYMTFFSLPLFAAKTTLHSRTCLYFFFCMYWVVIFYCISLSVWYHLLFWFSRNSSYLI